MATHSSVLAWRIPGTGHPGGLPSMGSHRVGHDWSNLAAAAAAAATCLYGDKNSKRLWRSTQVHLCSGKYLLCNTMDNFGEFGDLWLWRNTCQRLKIPLLMGIGWRYIYFKSGHTFTSKTCDKYFVDISLHISNYVNSFCCCC